MATRKQRLRTNVEMVTGLMDYSRNGALMQAFVLTAIDRYAQQCIAAGAETFDSPMLHGAAWVNCAQEAAEAVRLHRDGAP